MAESGRWIRFRAAVMGSKQARTQWRNQGKYLVAARRNTSETGHVSLFPLAILTVLLEAGRFASGVPLHFDSHSKSDRPIMKMNPIISMILNWTSDIVEKQRQKMSAVYGHIFRPNRFCISNALWNCKFFPNQIWLRHGIRSEKRLVSCYGQHAAIWGVLLHGGNRGTDLCLISNQSGRSIRQEFKGVNRRNKFRNMSDASTEDTSGPNSISIVAVKEWESLFPCRAICCDKPFCIQ